MLTKYLILFADHIVLFTTDAKTLQLQIDNLAHYSYTWGLKININKTKVCVFEKRKTNHNNEFFINGEKIEIVDNFTYLGIKFTYTGNLSYSVKALSEQALRAYHSLLSVFDRVHLDIKTKLSIFDAMVVPILLYGSEVWGVYDYKEVDKLHIKFCKYILGVRKQTSNYAVYGELGRFPLSVIAKERSLKFWLKIMGNVNSPVNSMYIDILNNVNGNCWAKRISNMIDNLGFTHIMNDFDNTINYLPLFKRRIRD